MSKTYRYICIVSALLVACSLIALPFCATDGVGLIISIAIGLAGIAALAAATIICATTFLSIDAAIKIIEHGRTDQLQAGTLPLIAPLVRALVNIAAPGGRRDEAASDKPTDTQADMSLQLRLLQKQKRNTEQIIHSIPDAVVVVDSFGRVTVANAAARNLFGFDMDPARAKPLGEVIDHAGFVGLVENSRQSGQQHVRHEIVFEKDSKTETYNCIISCVRDDKGQVCEVVAVLHDITRDKEISQMKNDFVSHVSHELKTPLASINAYAEMLVDGEAKDAEAITQFCSIIQSQAQRLNRLIEDILNISRIESGMVKVKKQKLSMAILIRDAAEMIESYAGEKNIELKTQTPIIFDQVHADRDMLSQVIINLLSNAVKYTEQGGTVSIQSDVNEAENYIRVTVTDSGVGIPKDDLPHVFDKFYRVEANKKQAKGTGLGLNLVSQIIEKVHGGRVFVTSKQGQGSTFGFEIPLATGQTVEIG